jgi:hypothetical protein
VRPDGEPSPHRQNPQLIWDEYKYRHDLCWRLVCQIATAVVVISVVPYIQTDVASKLQGWIIALPVIGILLALLGLARLDRELDLLRKVTLKHRELLRRNYSGLSYAPERYSFKCHVFGMHGDPCVARCRERCSYLDRVVTEVDVPLLNWLWRAIVSILAVAHMDETGLWWSPFRQCLINGISPTRFRRGTDDTSGRS